VWDMLEDYLDILPVDVVEEFWKGGGDLRLVGWQYRKINKTNHILLNVIEISYSKYFSSQYV